MMPANFDEFYEKINPFIEATIAGIHHKGAEIQTKKWQSFKLAMRAACVGVAGAVCEEVGLRLFPNSEKINNFVDKCDLKVSDCFVGIQQSAVLPRTMARNLPESLLESKFADCARQLNLPHIALVIEAGIQHFKPAAPTAQPN